MRSSSSDKGRRTRDVVFWLYVAGLAWAPFWFGSNDPVSWSINAIIFPALVVLYELNLILSGRPHPVPLRRIWFSAACFALVVVWILVQAATVTPTQWHNPVWAQTATLLGSGIAGSISIDRDATVLSLVRLLTVACSLWLAMQLCRNPARATALIRSVAVVGCLYAVYGLVAFYAAPGTVLWLPKVFYTESVTSTFINRNTYATYAALSFICLLGLSFDFSAEQTFGNARLLVANAISRAVGSAGLAALGALVVAAALLRTGSRGGVGATVLAAIVFLVLYLGFRRRGSRLGTLAVASAAVVASGFVVLTYGDLLASRLSTTELGAEGRTAAYALIWKAISDAFVQGFGYGTFADVFPLYRDPTVTPWFTWDKAHDTFLELALEIGVPATIVLLLSVGALVGRCLLAVRKPDSQAAPIIAVSATAVIVGTSLIDFGVQIQAVALTWVALLGAGFAQSQDVRGATRPAPERPFTYPARSRSGAT